MSRAREGLLDLITAIVAVGALALGGFVVYERMNPRDPNGEVEDREIDNWAEVSSVGRAIGAAHPRVTIVEFGDYECPACRGYEPVLRSVLAQFPDDVRLLYRHWPLTIHRSAYAGARAAECAAAQGAFERFHERLLDDDAWLTNAQASFARYAREAELPDSAAFASCAADSLPVEAIERDIAAAKDLQALGTPTLIINGTLIGSIPDSAGLVRLILSATPE